MPKLTVSETESANRIIRACIAQNMELYGKTDKEVATALRIAERTYQDKRDDPSRFKLEELRKLSKILKFTPVQCASILAGKALTSKDVREIIML